jgi:predicted phage-related endonuclease
MLTDEQRKARIGKMTSSVVAAALGLNPRMTPFQAWLAIRGEGENLDESRIIQRGNRLEALVLDEPCERYGWVRRDAEFRSVKPWAGDSADALYLDSSGERILAMGEGKTHGMGLAHEYGEENTDEVPGHVLVQSHWHLIHWPEAPRCVVPVLLGGYEFVFRLFNVERDNELHGLLMQDAEKWHRDYIVGDKAPPAEAGDNELLSQRYRKHSKGYAEDTPEIARLVQRRMDAYAAIKEAEKAKGGAEALLKQIIGDAEGVKGDWGKVYWRQQKGREYVDWQSLALERGATPEDIVRYTKHAEGIRPMRFYPKKDKSE